VKILTPFSVLKNVVSDISRIEFVFPKKTQQARADFWKKECNAHPTSSACITYD